MKQKILIFHPYLATYRVDLYNKLSIDFTVKVLLTGAPWEIKTLGFDLQKVNDQAKFDYCYNHDSKYLGRHPVSLIFYKTIKEFKPDIVIAHEYGTNTLAAIAHKHQFKYKLFVTCDDNVQMAQEYSWKRRLLRDFVVRHTDGIITVSTSTQQFLQQLYPNIKNRFLYFPIIQNDIELQNKIAVTNDIANRYIEQYNLQNKHTFLFVGRLEPVKCINTIIDTYSECADEDNILIIVGNGSLENELKSQVKQLNIENHVIFTGGLFGSELYAWYNVADTFILASKREAFGAVVNEALVGGCRCIVSDHCGAHTLITEKNGSIFEYGNTTQLRNCFSKEQVHGKKFQIISLMPQSFDELYRHLVNYITK